MEYNIYCDESCHLEHDNSDIMFIGGISCEKSDIKRMSDKIRKIKANYGIPKEFEFKWTKVSPSKLEFYKALLDMFFTSPLGFRCIIAKGKNSLDNDSYNQTYDEWYYKIYYLLLNKMIDPTEQYNIFIDIKDTNGGEKIRKLKTILNKSLYTFHKTCIKKIQIVKSDEILLLQLCDLIIGCIGYENRFLKSTSATNITHKLSDAKIQMCEHLKQLSHRPLTLSTPLSETKFNLFVWSPRS